MTTDFDYEVTLIGNFSQAAEGVESFDDAAAAFEEWIHGMDYSTGIMVRVKRSDGEVREVPFGGATP